jgi:hypothetical protein
MKGMWNACVCAQAGDDPKRVVLRNNDESW